VWCVGARRTGRRSEVIMGQRVARAAFLFAVLVVAAGPGAADGPFKVDTLVEGIHLFHPGASDAARTNSLVVEREDGLLVVDAQPTPAAAQELLAEIGRRFAKPVRFLVLTHPHADAAGGASAFPSTALVVASKGFLDAVGDASFDFGAEARERSAEPDRFVEPTRVRPTLVSPAPFTLDDRRFRVEILPIAKLPTHSSGDLAVWIPSAGVLAAGDVVWPSSNAYSRGANISNWLVSLNGLLDLRPTTVVALRGAAVDPRRVRVLRDAFAWIRGQVEDAFVNGSPSGKIADRILESPHSAKFLDLEATPSWVRQMIDQAVAEAVEYRVKHGLE
jgi:glyoxylase-like metal-dependent hydrolase (beta-lactamase superfamily II)